MFFCDAGGFAISILTIFYLIVANYSNYSIQLDSVKSLMKRRNKESVFDPKIVSINSTIDERLKIWYESLQ